MGSDDLFHKRKARSAKDLVRKGAKKSDYETILIVCEGTKTEPNYFKELIDELKLNTANVQVTASPSTCPRKLVEFALEQVSEVYDFVYCVFDKDKHAKYNEALQLINANSQKIFAVNSVPCFEYWLVLHYDFTTQAFYASARKSPGEEMVSKLRKFIPNYEKGNYGIFNLLSKKMNRAIENSDKANRAALAAKTDNPSTQIVALVRHLQKIRNAMDAN